MVMKNLLGQHILAVLFKSWADVPILTFVLQSLTVQSKDEVTNRWEKSTGPTAL